MNQCILIVKKRNMNLFFSALTAFILFKKVYEFWVELYEYALCAHNL